jgi:hypothetical protein
MSSREIADANELLAFDRQSRALVAEMLEHGWTGRLTSRGHALMYSPDGKTTMSLSRSSKRGRSGRNMAAEFERWKRRA